MDLISGVREVSVTEAALMPKTLTDFILYPRQDRRERNGPAGRGGRRACRQELLHALVASLDDRSPCVVLARFFSLHDSPSLQASIPPVGLRPAPLYSSLRSLLSSQTKTIVRARDRHALAALLLTTHRHL